VLYLVALGIAFYLVRLLGVPWPHFPLSFPDSFSFLKVARKGPFHPSFYFDERPIGFPLLAWVVGRSTTLITVTQTILYVAAFYALGRVLTRELSSRVIAVFAVVFLVAIAIEPRNSMWNTLVLSESLSNTCAMLGIAAWLRAASRPSTANIRWAWLATIAWMVVRDANVLPTMLVVVPTAVVLGFIVRGRDRRMSRVLISGAIVATLVGGYVYVAQNHSQRDVYAIYDNVGTRILPDPSLTQWFVDHGMPMDDAVRGRTGRDSWDDNSAFLQAPDLANMRSWARSSGSRVLAESAVLRFPDWWKRFHRDFPGILAYKLDAYDYFHVNQRLPNHLTAPLGEPRTTGGLAFWLVLAAAGIVAMAIDRRRRLVALFCSAGLVSVLVEIYFSYVGDSIEVQRHLVGSLLRLSVLLVVTTALGADSVLRMAREWSRSGPTDADAEPADADATPAEQPSEAVTSTDD
jgi:hypothetical protein